VKTLVVDDHPLFVSAMKEMLRQSIPEVIVHAAHSVPEALELMSGNAYQLILLDLQMPGQDGFWILRRLQDQGSAAAAVVVSSDEDPQVIETAIKAGAVGYIPKSLQPAAIREAIEQVLSGEIYTPRLAQAGASQHPVPNPESEEERVERCRKLGLSKKQYQVLLGLAEGLTNRQIAERLHVSIHAVKAHNAHIFQKLQANSRMAVVMEAMKLGLIGESERSESL
jgi:DNA-binding NarL/FixJ family response regulator